MRDIAVLIFLSACIIASIRCAWHGVLALAIFSYLNPHAFAWGFVRTLPAYQILFFVVLIATIMSKERQPIPKDWRIPVFVLLWLYFILTTTQAYFPALAWEKFWFVTKIYLPFAFTLVLIDTRQKLYYLIVTIACSIGFVAVKGGVFAITSGFAHRVYGPPGTQFYENNAFAIAVLIAIPLLLLWYKETPRQIIRYGITACIPIMIACAISSWSRGAFLTMGVLTLILLWHSKRKYLVIPILISAILLAPMFLPETWFGRMETLETYQEDESAMSRIRVWSDGWHHTLQHPFVGSGFEGWRWVSERDWHSSYVEMFSEHGFIAFALWMSLILGTLFSLSSLPRKTKNIEGLEWVANYCYMLRASLIAYMTGTLFLGLSYWDLLYHIIFIAVLVKKFALEELAEKHLRNPVLGKGLALKKHQMKLSAGR
ncbi:MAG: putative O-glycosylation ligase, exosortase A system-associated [Gammaproteobacteria bacterium]|nr:putative O-glycosylation ligase, exosortase A system-associated [Gammaproteobacteria bacterium]MBQ0838658.1 putative O-glycosylation ligase, exosortase A system-associated [Gammaproteobacteria bacterium]